uniref:Uncharacterized protein n=1 Tax=Nelumbo nucifera TaxID=4432 RepID=A0A822ZKA9_NELNU|nr:TPA_asm: hypothetical protein HUJ06_000398 [Nelumbo nucifera]
MSNLVDSECPFRRLRSTSLPFFRRHMDKKFSSPVISPDITHPEKKKMETSGEELNQLILHSRSPAASVSRQQSVTQVFNFSLTDTGFKNLGTFKYWFCLLGCSRILNWRWTLLSGAEPCCGPLLRPRRRWQGPSRFRFHRAHVPAVMRN